MSDDDSWGSGDESDDGGSKASQNAFMKKLQSNIQDAKEETCETCKVVVPFSTQMRIEGKVYHKNCLKCLHCGGKLTTGSYASLNGKFYCKPHFKQLFQTKGNYSEGFGEEDHKAKWAKKD